LRLEQASDRTTLWSYTCEVQDEYLSLTEAGIVADVLEALLPDALDRAGAAGDPAQYGRALELAHEALRLQPDYAAAHLYASLASYYLAVAGMRAFPDAAARIRLRLARGHRVVRARAGDRTEQGEFNRSSQHQRQGVGCDGIEEAWPLQARHPCPSRVALATERGPSRDRRDVLEACR
jgi:hypothetical protein